MAQCSPGNCLTLASAGLLTIALSGFAPSAPAQEGAPRWIDQLNRSTRELDAVVSRNIRPESRLGRHADRVVQRAAGVANARQALDERKLTAVHDAAIVLKSELLDSAPQVHPEQLTRLEQMLGYTEAIAGQAMSGTYADAESLDELSARIASSTWESAEELLEAVTSMREAVQADPNRDLQRIVERTRALRDQIESLSSENANGADQRALAAANLAINLRADLLVLAFQESGPEMGTLQPVRRALLGLENGLIDFASIAAQQQGRGSPGYLPRTAEAVALTQDDLKALRDAAPDRHRPVMEQMMVDTQRLGTDVQNLLRDSSYSPRRRLEDVYGRITRVIEQTDEYAPQVNDRTRGLLHIAQADLVALRELALMAAAEQLGLFDRSASTLLPQIVNVDLSAEEQLGVKLSVQDGRLTLARVSPRGIARAAGLRAGDVLVRANDRELQTDVDLAMEVDAAARGGEPLQIIAERQGERLSRRLSIGSTPRHANRSDSRDGNR